MEVESLFLSIGLNTEQLRQGFQTLSRGAAEVDKQYNALAGRVQGVFSTIAAQIAAPVAAVMGVGKVINSYMSDIASVATMTGAYSQKLEEWRIKRAMLSRVTREDIELYKKGREAIVGFRIAMADLSAKIMREAMPVMKFMIDGLNTFSKWCDRNGNNIVRFLKVTAGVITALFLPALIKMGAAMLANPLTWMVMAIVALIAVIDDLVVYMQGGESALGDFWSIFGTGEEITAALTTAFTALKAIAAALWKPLAALAGGFAAFKTGQVAIRGLMSAFMALRNAMLLVAANPLVVAFTAIVAAITWVMDALDRAGGDWSQVVGIMGQDIVDFLNIFGGLGDKVAAVFAEFGAPIKAVADIVVGMIQTVVQAVQLFWAYITSGSEETKEQLAANLKAAFSGVISAIGNLISSAAELLWQALVALVTNIPDILSGVVALAGSILSTLADALLALGGFLLDALTQLFAGLWDAITGGAQSLASSVADTFSGLIDRIADFFGGIGAAAANAVSSLLQVLAGIGSSIAGFFAAALNTASELWAAFTDGAAAVFESIAALPAAALELISSALSAALDFFAGIGSTISNAFGGALASVGGFFRDLGATAASIGSSIMAALSGAATAVLDAFTGLWNSITQGASALISSVVGVVSSLPAAVASIFDQVVSTITGAFTAAWQAAQNFFEMVFSFLASIPARIAEAFDITGAISGAIDGVKEKLGGAFDGVKDFFGFGGDDDKEKDGATTAPQKNATNSDARTGGASNTNYSGNGPATQTPQQQGHAQSQTAPSAQTSAPPAQASTAQSPALPSPPLLQQVQQASEQQALLRNQMPVNANSASYVNTTNNTNNNQSTANSSEVTNNITINAGNGDPRAVRMAVMDGLSSANNGAPNYVSSSEDGTMAV